MSTEIPGLPESNLDDDDDAGFDDLAYRAGAALRRPAPADGVRLIAARQRRQQALKASVVGGVAVVAMIGVLVIVANRHDLDRVPPVDSSPITTPATTTPPPTPTASLPVESSPTTSPITTPTATSIAPGEEISVTPDFIEFGDHLVGFVGRTAKDGGRTYVLPGQIAEPPPSGEFLVNSTETAVLAAFDDSSQELWRTELDGRPTDVAVADGDPWVVFEDGTVSRIDASDGRIVGSVTLASIGALPEPMVGAFGSLWVHTDDGASEHIVRVDPDLSTTRIEIPSLPAECDNCPRNLTAGNGGIWIPRGDLGVAVIDSDTNQLTIIPRDVIGHAVLQVAVDGDVAYVASGNQVTSIVDGEIVATHTPGDIWYLGPLDGEFGVLLSEGRFQVLEANDPMVVADRQISTEGQSGPVKEIAGEAWVEVDRNYDLRRVELLPTSTAGG